jgi:hypothetical protein
MIPIPWLAAVVEDCSSTGAYAMFSNQLSAILGLPEFPIMACVDVVSGINTGTKITDAAPLKAVPRIKVPVLFIHGAADTLVPPVMMGELFAACKVKKEKLIIEEAGHGDAMVTDREKYWDWVLIFYHDAHCRTALIRVRLSVLAT